MRGSLVKLSKSTVTHVLRSPVGRVPSRSLVSLLSARPHPAELCNGRRWNSTGSGAELNDALDEQSSIDKTFAHPGALIACPGCGALAQTVEQGEPGYYSLRRKAVSSFVKQDIENDGSEQSLAATAINRADPTLLESLGLDKWTPEVSKTIGPALPLCDRCHQLIHHHVGVPIHHPSIESIADTIDESPYKYNHIYHVIDAADFPMSLVKNLDTFLDTSGLRSKNRRAKHTRYRHNKVTELSFVITRSDLIAPKKEQVDGLMPYIVEVLRDALGSAAKEVRLGNVRCVSAKRGWWTKELKADVWKRGGGGWMVGKVNVGKSNLFEVVFPKGKAEDINFDSVRRSARRANGTSMERLSIEQDEFSTRSEISDEDSLLPPARVETPFPVMPTISSLPGTTASPIRIPFGNGKGELIDLPGLARSDLDQCVKPEHRDTLVMKARQTPEQYVIKPGQSLLLGGLVRITPTGQDDLVILAYPFIPLKPHLSTTEKAIDIQTGARELGSTESIVTQEAQGRMASAGVFELKWDVTKQRAGPLTTSAGAGLKPRDLPFTILSTDILIESVGWIELVAQVRKPRTPRDGNEMDRNSNDVGEFHAGGRQNVPMHYPRVEVFSPEGKFIASRRPMNAWVLGGVQKRSSKEKGRPRKSMSGVRRRRQGVSGLKEA